MVNGSLDSWLIDVFSCFSLVPFSNKKYTYYGLNVLAIYCWWGKKAVKERNGTIVFIIIRIGWEQD